MSVDDLSLTTSYGTKGFRLCAGKPIANQVVRVVDVLLHVVPEAPGERLPTRMEQLGPRIRASEDRFGNHDAGQRAERQAIAGISGRRVLVIRALSDVWDPIGR